MFGSQGRKIFLRLSIGRFASLPPGSIRASRARIRVARARYQGPRRRFPAPRAALYADCSKRSGLYLGIRAGYSLHRPRASARGPQAKGRGHPPSIAAVGQTGSPSHASPKTEPRSRIWPLGLHLFTLFALLPLHFERRDWLP